MISKDELFKQYQNYLQTEIKPICYQVATEIVELYHLELSKLYDEIIRQYYLYETTSYYRHNEGIGTKKGKNLYEAFLSEIEYNTEGYVNSYMLNISADLMEDKNYKFSKDVVLDMVLNGIRGVPKRIAGEPKGSGYLKNQLRFILKSGSFKAEVEFDGVMLSGTPKKIMSQVTDIFMVASFVNKRFSVLFKKRIN